MKNIYRNNYKTLDQKKRTRKVDKLIILASLYQPSVIDYLINILFYHNYISRIFIITLFFSYLQKIYSCMVPIFQDIRDEKHFLLLYKIINYIVLILTESTTGVDFIFNTCLSLNLKYF